MSETRRARQELRQSFTQHLFHYYGELKRTTSEEEAKRIVREVSSELLEPFGGGPTGPSLFSSLEGMEQRWLEKETHAIKERDADLRMQAMDVLQALKVLKPAAIEEEQNGIK